MSELITIYNEYNKGAFAWVIEECKNRYSLCLCEGDDRERFVSLMIDSDLTSSYDSISVKTTTIWLDNKASGLVVFFKIGEFGAFCILNILNEEQHETLNLLSKSNEIFLSRVNKDGTLNESYTIPNSIQFCCKRILSDCSQWDECCEDQLNKTFTELERRMDNIPPVDIWDICDDDFFSYTCKEIINKVSIY